MVLLSAQGLPVAKIAKSKPAEHGLPFSTWSLAKLAGFLVAEGVVDDISHEGLRILLREEGVSSSSRCTAPVAALLRATASRIRRPLLWRPPTGR